MSKSARIRHLYDTTEMTVKQIAQEVGVRYQFAYNVIRQMVDRRGETVRKSPIQFGTPEAIAEAQRARQQHHKNPIMYRSYQQSDLPEISRPKRREPQASEEIRASEIRALLEAGFDPRDIAEELEVNISFVNNVAKLLKKKQQKVSGGTGASGKGIPM